MLKPRYSSLKEAISDFYSKIGSMDAVDLRGPGVVSESPEHAAHASLTDKAHKAISDVMDYAREVGIDPHALVHTLPHHHRGEMYSRHKAALDALNTLIQYAQEVQDRTEPGTQSHHEWSSRQHHAYKMKEPHEHAISRYHSADYGDRGGGQVDAGQQQAMKQSAPAGQQQAASMESVDLDQFRLLAGLTERVDLPWDIGRFGTTKHNVTMIAEAAVDIGALKAKLAGLRKSKEDNAQPSARPVDVPPPRGYEVRDGMGGHAERPEEPAPAPVKREEPRPAQVRRPEPRPKASPEAKPEKKKKWVSPLDHLSLDDLKRRREADPLRSRESLHDKRVSQRAIPNRDVEKALRAHDEVLTHARRAHEVLADKRSPVDSEERKRIMDNLAWKRDKLVDHLRTASMTADGKTRIELRSLAIRHAKHADMYRNGGLPALEGIELAGQILAG